MYGNSISAASLTSHLETQHDVYHLHDLEMDLTLHNEETEAVFEACYSRKSGKYFCLVPGCTGEAAMVWNLLGHFVMRHPNRLVDIAT